MIVKMSGIYGLENAVSYYRKSGYCFDFVNDVKCASELTREEAESVLDNADWYCIMYGAKRMEIIESCASQH